MMIMTSEHPDPRDDYAKRLYYGTQARPGLVSPWEQLSPGLQGLYRFLVRALIPPGYVIVKEDDRLTSL